MNEFRPDSETPPPPYDAGEEPFLNSLANDPSPRRFLQATPFSRRHWRSYDKTLSEDTFWLHLYSKGDSFQSMVEELRAEKASSHVAGFILYGYQGIGKTTFVRRLLNGDGAEIIDWEGMEVEERPVATKLANTFWKYVRDDSRDTNRHCPILRVFYDAFFAGEAASYSRAVLEPGFILDSVIRDVKLILAPEPSGKTPYDLLENLRRSLHELSPKYLLKLITLWVLMRITLSGEKRQFWLVLDNLDVIQRIAELGQLQAALNSVHVDVPVLLGSSIPGSPLIDPLIMDRFGYIVVLRETTTAYFDEHTTEAWNQAFPRRDITGRVAGPQIIGERQKYIDRRKTDFEGSSQSRAHLAGLALHCQTLSSILSNGYFRRNIYPAFNYDHRNAVTALTQAFCAAGASVDKLASNMQSGTQLNRHLARQAALRRLLNVFADSGYFDAIKGTEDRQPLGRGEGTSINTSRLILNTLLFGPRPLPPEALRDPRLGKGFSLMDLFGTFDPFIKPKVIAEALWAMFAIRGEESWAHLVTFKSHRPRNQDDLWEQADDYGSNARTRSKFSEVKITPAGVKFVTDFLGTYEYFASRIDGTAGCALYETDFDSKLDPLAYKAGMNRVLAEVQHCLGNIQVYHSEIMLNTRRGGIEPHAFLQSPLSYHVRRDSDTLGERRALVYDDEGRFYADQVINSHIGYLDSFRRWAGATRPDLAEEISDIVMGVIDGYIDIPKRGWLDISISRESMDLLEDYRRAREWISGDVGTRWRTPIDRVTGGRLRRGEPPLPARRR